jgi:hypothetical protein
MDRRELDGLILHPAVGKLGILDAAQHVPISAMTTDPLVPGLTEVWPHHLTKTREYAILKAWSLRDFYIPTEEDPSPANLIAGVISYINCILPAEAMEGRGLLVEALHLPTYVVPTWRDASPHNLNDFQNDETLGFMRLFRGDSQCIFIHDRNQQLGILGLLLLLIGKSVTTAGYEGWVSNRLKTFRGVLGISEDNFIWSIGMCPAQRILASLSTFQCQSTTENQALSCLFTSSS